MGKDNRARRAAKRRKAAAGSRTGSSAGSRSRTGSRTGSPRGPRRAEDDHGRPTIDDLLYIALESKRNGDLELVERAVVELASRPPTRVGAELERLLGAGVARAWDNGWLPAEVMRQVGRASSRSTLYARCAIAIDHASRAPQTLHPRWVEHLAQLQLHPEQVPKRWIAELATERGAETIEDAIAAIDALGTLGPVTVLIPPPGSDWRAESDRPVYRALEVDDDPVLAKVRALLAQAESTTFPAEAETFTAKAQELMARHSIDAALLWSQLGGAEDPITIRIPIDDPYAEQKSWLAQIVAEHSRCRAVYMPRYGLSSLVGFAGDLALAETLFTSLLVQAHVALKAEAANAPPGSRTRSRSFRQSFYAAYAGRIGERLHEVNEQVEAERGGEEDAGDLLPVLAQRSERVDTVLGEAFPDLTHGAVKAGHDWLGWDAGERAADEAQLSTSILDRAG